MKYSLKALFTVLVMTGALLFAQAAFAADDVEISFKVGDSTLLVNGKEMTVTTPYVVDGTTLVPLRVITESFGAEVSWDGETKTVTVIYSDVTIKLTIGNKVALINGKEVELLAAPELTNDTTMLPLRFITESFGADVSYDNETAAIKVIKEMTETNSIKDFSLILKRSDKEYVGDSFYGWAMKRSPRLSLYERGFDGTHSYFSDDSIEAYFYVDIYDLKDETIDTALEEYRKISKDYTTYKLTKVKTASGIEYALLQFKGKESYNDFRTYIYKDKIYKVTVSVSSETEKKEFENLCSLADTFDFKFSGTTAEDLSDVNKETNMHTYVNDDIGIMIDIPGSYVIDDSKDKFNEVHFYSHYGFVDSDRVSITVYSTDEKHNSKTWMENDYNWNKDMYNPKYATFGKIDSITVDGKTANYYTYDVNYNDAKKKTKDIFIDAGEYFYNITIRTDADKELSTMENIIKSIKFKEINKDEVGTIIRTYSIFKETTYKDYNIDAKGASFKLPDTWEEKKENDFYGFGSDEATCSMFVSFVTKEDTRSLLKDYVDYMSDKLFEQEGIISKSAPKSIMIDSKSAYRFSYTIKGEDEDKGLTYYCYVVESKKYIALISFSSLDLYDGDETQETMDYIMDSFSIK